MPPVSSDSTACQVPAAISSTVQVSPNKKLFPWSQFIVDSNGLVRKAWQLDEKSSAIVVLDKNGRVQWAKDGALTQQEVQQVIDLLHKLLNK